jgi:hypothetical protein
VLPKTRHTSSIIVTEMTDSSSCSLKFEKILWKDLFEKWQDFEFFALCKPFTKFLGIQIIQYSTKAIGKIMFQKIHGALK